MIMLSLYDANFKLAYIVCSAKWLVLKTAGMALYGLTRSIWKKLGPFATASRRYIASHQVSLVARQL